MFKPGEIAVTKNGQKVVITANVVPGSTGHRWPVATNEGVFDELDLFVAHPTVLETANPAPPTPKSDLELAPAEKEALAHDRQGRKRFQKEVLSKMTIDWGGHWKSGKDLHEGVRDEMLNSPLSFFSIAPNDIEAILQAPDFLLDRWVWFRLLDIQKCSVCGERVSMETNGKVVRPKKRCQFPEGFPPNEWELNVPSGKLVVANDLRQLFPLPDDDGEFDVNTILGCRQRSQAYAAIGMAHAYVGNTCPNVYRCKDGTFKIANEPGE